MKSRHMDITMIITVLIVISMILNTAFADTSTKINGTVYTHPSAKQKGNIIVINGVDVSYWQGNNINWTKAKQDGIDFAFLRIGFSGTSNGACNKDSTFETNIKNAQAAGVNVGIYYWSEATTEAEAKKEAEYVSGILEKHKKAITMPVAMDYEFAKNSRSLSKWNSIKNKSGVDKARSTFTNIAKKWMDTIKSKGYTPAYYSYYALTNPSTGTRKVNMKDLTGYKFWYAQYNNKVSYTGSLDHLEFWQHTSSGSVSGMSGRIDRNFWYYDTNGDGTAANTTSIRKCNIALKYKQMKYTGKALKDPVTVTYNGKALTEGTDYQLIYVKNINKGSAQVIVKGIKGYSDNISFTYTIGTEDTLNEITKPAKVEAVNTVVSDNLSKISISYSAAKNSVTYTVRCKDLKTGETKTYDTKGKTSFDIPASAGSVFNISVRGVNEKDGSKKNGTYSDEKTVYVEKSSVKASYSSTGNCVTVTASSTSEDYELNMLEIDSGNKYIKTNIKKAVAGKEKIRVRKDRKYCFELIPYTSLPDKTIIKGEPAIYGIHTYTVPYSTNVKSSGDSINIVSSGNTAAGDKYYIRYSDNAAEYVTVSANALPYTLKTTKNHIYDISVKKNITDKNIKYTCKNSPDITYGSMKYSGYYGSVTHRLAQKTKITKLTSAKKGQITLTYDKKSCTGYEIYVSLKSDLSKSKKTVITGSSKTTATISGLASGKTYYVKIRPYKTSKDIKYTGQFNSVSKIKTK